MELEKIIGCNIRRLRISTGWKQKELADVYGSSIKFISLIETGRKWLGKNVFNRFCAIFNVDPYELIKLPQKENIEILCHEIEQLNERKTLIVNKFLHIIFNIKPEQMILLDGLEQHIINIYNYILELFKETKNNNLTGP
jgi:transcriptional regulator with XRE-family HTH domain